MDQPRSGKGPTPPAAVRNCLIHRWFSVMTPGGGQMRCACQDCERHTENGRAIEVNDAGLPRVVCPGADPGDGRGLALFLRHWPNIRILQTPAIEAASYRQRTDRSDVCRARGFGQPVPRLDWVGQIDVHINALAWFGLEGLGRP